MTVSLRSTIAVRYGSRVHGQMDLAVRAVLKRQPFTFIRLTQRQWGYSSSSRQELDPRTFDQQIERSRRTAVKKLNGQGLLSAAQRGEVRYRPIKPCQCWSQEFGPVARLEGGSPSPFLFIRQQT